MSSDEVIPLLGLTSEDERVKKFLAACGITKLPKLKSDETDIIVANKKLGIEITLVDEDDLDVKSQEYEEGSLVLSNVRMYGDDHPSFHRFKGELPHGLKFEIDRKKAQSKLGKKPGWDNKDLISARWDFKTHCVFLTFDEKYSKIRVCDIQLPVK